MSSWSTAAAGLPTQRLDLDTKVAGEMDGVQHMPAVETEALLALIETVGTEHLGHAEVRGGVFGVAVAGDVEVQAPPK